jgi:hypothetical protein
MIFMAKKPAWSTTGNVSNKEVYAPVPAFGPPTIAGVKTIVYLTGKTCRGAGLHGRNSALFIASSTSLSIHYDAKLAIALNTAAE